MSEKEDIQPKQRPQMTDHEKRANTLSMLALAVAILVPVLTAVLGIGQYMERVDSGSGKVGIQKELAEALKTLDARKKEALTAIQDATPDDNMSSQLSKRLKQLEDSPLYSQKFCILQAGGGCPTGFFSGRICIDSEDEENRDYMRGTVGDSGQGTCGRTSKEFLLCCKTE